jgi:hypothetical protein
MPHTPFTRRKEFVRQEWNAMFSANASTPADKVEGGWKGVLYANLALIDPKAAWEFFTQPNFDYSWIDGGATRTWYLAFAAGKSSFFSWFDEVMLQNADIFIRSWWCALNVIFLVFGRNGVRGAFFTYCFLLFTLF